MLLYGVRRLSAAFGFGLSIIILNLATLREAHEAQGDILNQENRKTGIGAKDFLRSCFSLLNPRPEPSRRDCEQRHNREMFGAVLFVRNDQ